MIYVMETMIKTEVLLSCTFYITFVKKYFEFVNNMFITSSSKVNCIKFAIVLNNVK